MATSTQRLSGHKQLFEGSTQHGMCPEGWLKRSPSTEAVQHPLTFKLGSSLRLYEADVRPKRKRRAQKNASYPVNIADHQSTCCAVSVDPAAFF